MHLRYAGPLAPLAALLAGCFATQPTLHSGEAVVQGRVLVKGEPLLGGTVYASPVSMPYATFTTAIGPDGTFLVRRCLSGPVRFAVDHTGYVPAPAEVTGVPPPKLPPIPKVYQDVKTTPLVIDLPDGHSENVILDIK